MTAWKAATQDGDPSAGVSLNASSRSFVWSTLRMTWPPTGAPLASMPPSLGHWASAFFRCCLLTSNHPLLTFGTFLVDEMLPVRSRVQDNVAAKCQAGLHMVRTQDRAKACNADVQASADVSIRSVLLKKGLAISTSQRRGRAMRTSGFETGSSPDAGC